MCYEEGQGESYYRCDRRRNRWLFIVPFYWLQNRRVSYHKQTLVEHPVWYVARFACRFEMVI